MMRLDVKLVESSFAYSGHKPFPYAGTSASAQHMRFGIPLIERADDRNFARVRSPNTEAGSQAAAWVHDVGAQLIEHAVMAALVEEVKILLAEQRDVIVNKAGGTLGALGHRFQRRPPRWRRHLSLSLGRCVYV